MLGDPNFQNDDDTEEFPNLFVSLALFCSVFNACIVTLSLMKALVWVSNKQSVEFPKLILKIYTVAISTYLKPRLHCFSLMWRNIK